MGTTNTTTGSNQSTLQFNPASQQIYNSLTSKGGSQLSGMIDNPFGNALYGMGLQQSQKGAQAQGQNNMNTLAQNQRVQGLGGQAGAGWLAAQKAMTGRANTSMMSGANISNVMQALQRQMAATGMGMSYSPQLTGQSGNFSQQQTSSGLGTWLPQLIGAAGGMAMGAMTGGASTALTGAMGGMKGSMGGVGSPTMQNAMTPGLIQSLGGMGFNTINQSPVNPFSMSMFQ